jgi:hypothetical protein
MIKSKNTRISFTTFNTRVLQHVIPNVLPLLSVVLVVLLTYSGFLLVTIFGVPLCLILTITFTAFAFRAKSCFRVFIAFHSLIIKQIQTYKMQQFPTPVPNFVTAFTKKRLVTQTVIKYIRNDQRR